MTHTMSEELKAAKRLAAKIPAYARDDDLCEVRTGDLRKVLSRTPTEAIDPPSVEGLGDVVERVRQLLHKRWPHSSLYAGVIVDVARDIAALTAMPATGMVTEAMVEAGVKAIERSQHLPERERAKFIFRAMIAAAQKDHP